MSVARIRSEPVEKGTEEEEEAETVKWAAEVDRQLKTCLDLQSPMARACLAVASGLLVAIENGSIGGIPILLTDSLGEAASILLRDGSLNADLVAKAATECHTRMVLSGTDCRLRRPEKGDVDCSEVAAAAMMAIQDSIDIRSPVAKLQLCKVVELLRRQANGQLRRGIPEICRPLQVAYVELARTGSTDAPRVLKVIGEITRAGLCLNSRFPGARNTNEGWDRQ